MMDILCATLLLFDCIQVCGRARKAYKEVGQQVTLMI